LFFFFGCGGYLSDLYDVRLNYLFDVTGRRAVRVHARQWFPPEDDASLSGCWRGLCGYPSVDAGLDSSP